jgi:hypothetical protein
MWLQLIYQVRMQGDFRSGRRAMIMDDVVSPPNDVIAWRYRTHTNIRGWPIFTILMVYNFVESPLIFH